MGPRRAGPIALDAGALIALETHRGRALIRLWERDKRSLVLSAGALAQAWRDPRRQVTLSRLIRHEQVEICPLDAATAKACGQLLGARSTSDVIDAHVVLTALEKRASVIVTSDPDDLAHLNPKAELARI